MFPVLHIGPLAIQAPGLFLLAGLWLGMSLTERYSVQFGVKKAHLSDVIFWSVLVGLLAARLTYAAQHPAAYLSAPLSLFALDDAALTAWGGFAGAGLAALVLAQRREIPRLALLDALTPLFAVLGAAIPLANLASGNGYGIPTALPWGIPLWGATRHPVQVYEFIAEVLILMGVWPPSGDRSSRLDGRVFLRFAAFTAGARLFLGVFRADLPALVGGLRIAQVAAWGVLAVSLWGLNRPLSATQEGDETRQEPSPGQESP
ncbi:MAG: prolipoprotein diacylglyceryl transferase [Anaerolineales bacterium]